MDSIPSHKNSPTLLFMMVSCFAKDSYHCKIGRTKLKPDISKIVQIPHINISCVCMCDLFLIIYHTENDLQPTKRKRANCGTVNQNTSRMNALGGVTNTYRGGPLKRNAKPKVDHHNKPIDPSLLMKQFNQTPVSYHSWYSL